MNSNSNRNPLAVALLAGMLCLAHEPVVACGENQFSTGGGLRYQGFLAPRPATVVVVDDGPGDRDELYAGLAKAGHRVTVVANREGLATVLANGKVDVLIADLQDVDAMTSEAPSGTRVLPVVARKLRDAPETRDRFDLILLEGASLGQYLKSIDSLIGTVKR